VTDAQAFALRKALQAKLRAEQALATADRTLVVAAAGEYVNAVRVYEAALSAARPSA
jgi:hypothetical protein